MPHLWSDVRFGVRMLVRHRTLSIASILTFGLGIGLATTVFTIVNGTLYKGLPFEEAERFVAVVRADASTRENLGRIAVHDFAVYEASEQVFESFGLWSVGSVNLVWGEGQAERFSAASLTVGALDATRVKPVLGRAFRAGEDRPGAEPVVLIGYRLWRDRFGGSPDVIGRSVRANGVARTIVGVMPERFAFPDRQQLWMPLEIDPLATARGKGPSYDGVARLRAGVSIEEAQARMAAIAARLAREFPETNRTTGVAVVPFLKRVFAAFFALCYTMLGAGIGVLLIACANVSNLLIARASLRQREVAVRLAIGAGRRRVLSQMLTEVTLLALAGAVLGVAIDEASIRWFVAAVEKNPPPFFITFDTDWRVLLFVTGITFAASLAAGLLPAWQATRVDAISTLRDEGRGATGFRVGRLRSALVVAEITVSCALLVGAGLMVKSVAQVKTASLPFTVDGILTAWVQLPAAVYPDPASRAQFVERLLPRLQEVAGVDSATIASSLPASDNADVPVLVAGRSYGRASDVPVARFCLVTPGYFTTFGVGIVRGREFTALDGPDQAPVAIVNESFGRQFFRGENPIGRTFRRGPAASGHPWLTVVGVVPDLLMRSFFRTGPGGAGYYIPAAQSAPGGSVAIAVRMRRGTAATAAALQAAVASVDPDLAVFDVRSMQAVIDVQTMFYTVFGTFFMAFGAAGLFLAAAGLYAVMSFSVTQRTREFGVRSALGARGGQLLLLVMRKVAWQSLVGLALGVVLALVAGDPLARILYDVHPRDPVVFSVVVVTLAAVCLLAGLFAARRVVGLHPAKALGTE